MILLLYRVYNGTHMDETIEHIFRQLNKIEARLEAIEKQLEKNEKEHDGDADDPLLDEAALLTRQSDKISASFLQRRLIIGYSRAARILDQLEKKGIVGPGEGGRPRSVLRKTSVNEPS